MELPQFRYHPDPIGTGNIEVSDTVCIVCGQARGYIYTSHVYSVEEYDDCICPWCIADDSAHKQLKVMFFDDVGVGARWERVAKKIVDEIVYRTPGFSGWQQEEWFTHCKDAAAFLGRMGCDELLAYGDEAIAAIREDTSLGDDKMWAKFLKSLDKDGAPTAYLFRCLHCGQYGGYTDCD